MLEVYNNVSPGMFLGEPGFGLFMRPGPSATGIYVHVPFCRVRCSYCAFAVTTSLSRHDAYFDALHRELAARVPAGLPVDTIYLGGGTPSRASIDAVTGLLERLRATARVAVDAEVTLEANPEDVSDEALEGWRRAGVNRVSMGVQSLSDVELRTTGRRHDAASASRALQRIVDAGFRTNADLIIGLPDQTLASFEASLSSVLATGVGHLSCYLLDLEEGTALASRVARRVTTLPEDDLYPVAYARLLEMCGGAGLRQYEISNLARPGDESRHNLRYWTGEPYIGLGMSAHSFDGRDRFANSADLGAYIRGVDAGGAEVFRETLDETARLRERLFLGLRRVEGFDEEEFLRLVPAGGPGWIERGRTEGWLHGGRVAFTTSGFLMSNGLIAELF